MGLVGDFRSTPQRCRLAFCGFLDVGSVVRFGFIFLFVKQPSDRKSIPDPSAQLPVLLVPHAIIFEERMSVNGERRWRRAIHLLCRNTTLQGRLQEIIDLIPYISIPVRKEILKIARCQSALSSNPFLRSQTLSIGKKHKGLPRTYVEYLCNGL
jgi:hypothetical protein